MLTETDAPRTRHLPAALTVADGLMLLIGGLAAWLRFGELTRLPLSAAEATAALANWQFWSAAPLTTPPASPAYFTFTNLVMGLGGAGDAAARLVPALFGTLTVLLPWLWRGRARPLLWLVAALFMAVSPILVAVSRSAGGDAIALFALLLLAAAASRLGDGRRWAALAGAAFGLGAAASPLFYSGLMALLPAAVVVRPTQLTRDDALRPAVLRPAAIAAALVFVVVAGGGLLYPAGIGAALRIVPQWLAQFSLPASAADFLSPFMALLRYEPAALLLGAPAVLWSLADSRRRGRFLAIWLGLALLVIALQSTTMSNAAAALLPAYLLVGSFAAALGGDGQFRLWTERPSYLTAIGLLLLGALLLTVAGRFVRLNLLAGQNATLVTLAAVAFLLAGLAVVLAMAWESPAARRGAFIGAAVLLLFWQWGAAWQLSRLGANDPRERWVTAGTSVDFPVMLDLIRGISRQTANSERDLRVFSLVDSPVLRWYLRDYNGFTIGPALPLEALPDVIITPVDVEPELAADYFGADFGLEQREAAATQSIPSDVLKWWLFRESGAVPEATRVVLWVRTDLARPE